MALSDVRICNLALGKLGVTTFIESLDEQSKEANVCELYYEQTRDELLTEVDWKFAEERITLATAALEAPAPWAYVYVFPSGRLKLRRIDNLAVYSAPQDEIPFETAFDQVGQQRLIYTNQAKAVGLFTAKATNPLVYPPMFVNALVARLAWKLAMPLTQDPRRESDAQEKYEIALSSAAARELNERKAGNLMPESSFERARY